MSAYLDKSSLTNVSIFFPGLHLQQRPSKFSAPLAPEEGLVYAFQLEEEEKENEEEFVCSYQAPEVKEEGNDLGDPAIVSAIQNMQVSQQVGIERVAPNLHLSRLSLNTPPCLYFFVKTHFELKCFIPGPS